MATRVPEDLGLLGLGALSKTEKVVEPGDELKPDAEAEAAVKRQLPAPLVSRDDNWFLLLDVASRRTDYGPAGNQNLVKKINKINGTFVLNQNTGLPGHFLISGCFNHNKLVLTPIMTDILAVKQFIFNCSSVPAAAPAQIIYPSVPAVNSLIGTEQNDVTQKRLLPAWPAQERKADWFQLFDQTREESVRPPTGI